MVADDIKLGCLVAAAAFLSVSNPAHASDFTPLAYLLLGAFAAIFVVAFAVVWFATRRMRSSALRVLLRAAVIALFWTPAQMDGAGYWWPLVMSWGELGALPHKSIVVISVLAVTALVWLPAWAWTRFAANNAQTCTTASETTRSHSDPPAAQDIAP